MTIFTEIIGVGSIIAIVLMVIAKFLPNEKLYGWGYKLGVGADMLGNSKLGPGWEKLEDFLVNSIGIFLEGFKDGLDPEENPRDDENVSE